MSTKPAAKWQEIYRGPSLQESLPTLTYAPLVTIPQQAYRKIQELCRKSGRNEVGWFGTMRLVGSQAVIDEVFLLEQEVTSVTTDIRGLTKLASRLLKEGRDAEVNKLHAWFHCHPGSGVTPSGQDESTYQELCKSSETILMMIFSKDATRAYARLRFHGMDIHLGWCVVGPVEEFFPNFADLVKEEQRVTQSPFCEGETEWEAYWAARQSGQTGGYVIHHGPGGNGAGGGMAGRGYQPSQPRTPPRIEKRRATEAARPTLTVDELKDLEKELRAAGYSEEDIKRIYDRAVTMLGREPGQDPPEKKSSVILVGGSGKSEAQPPTEPTKTTSEPSDDDDVWAWASGYGRAEDDGMAQSKTAEKDGPPHWIPVSAGPKASAK